MSAKLANKYDTCCLTDETKQCKKEEETKKMHIDSPLASYIYNNITLQQGGIENMGTYDELLKTGTEFSALLSNASDTPGAEKENVSGFFY